MHILNKLEASEVKTSEYNQDYHQQNVQETSSHFKINLFTNT
jgi:hypothetical protein